MGVRITHLQAEAIRDAYVAATKAADALEQARNVTPQVLTELAGRYILAANRLGQATGQVEPTPVVPMADAPTRDWNLGQQLEEAKAILRDVVDYHDRHRFVEKPYVARARAFLEGL